MTRLATLEELFPDHVAGLWGQEAGTLAHDVRIIRNGDVQTDGSVRWEQLPIRAVSSKELAKSSVQIGDLLLTTSGNCARIAIIDRDDGAVCASNFTRRLRADPAIAVPRYLFHLMRGDRFRKLCAPYIRGTTLENLSVKDAFAAVQLPLPPIEEQRRIASILDATDALRAKRSKALSNLDALTQSIFIDMFGDPVSNPAGWPKVAIGQLGRVVTGKTPPGTKKDMFGHEVPFVTPGDLESSTPVARWLSLEGARNSRLVPAGSTLVCCIGATIGKVAEAPVESAFNQQINAVDWDRSLVQPAYGTRVMRFMRREIARRGTSTTMPLLNKTDFSQLEVPFPPMDLQTDFRNRARSLSEVHTRSAIQGRQLNVLYQSLQHQAFGGEL